MTMQITEANDFVERTVCRVAIDVGLRVRGALRCSGMGFEGLARVVVSSLDDAADWTQALAGCQEVVHTYARVHVMTESANNRLYEFRRANVQRTLHLAIEATASGVRRFVFVSSVKVNGEATTVGHPLTAADTPTPQDPYGYSNMEAEQGLRQIATETGMEVVIVRPPLVYDPGVKANFASLMRAVQRGIPFRWPTSPTTAAASSRWTIWSTCSSPASTNPPPTRPFWSAMVKTCTRPTCCAAWAIP